MLKCINMLYIILVLLLMNIVNTSEASDRLAVQKTLRRKSFASLVFTTNTNYRPSSQNPCQWLSRLKRQSKQCGQRGGLPEILLDAKILAVNSCEKQFQFERWNCSNRNLFFQKMYRETALMYSMASSAVMFSAAKACSEGKLAGCSCGKPGKPAKNTTWDWGKCHYNTKAAKMLTRKFLQLKKKGDKTKGLTSIMKHNMEVGINVVLKNEFRDCKCHGVSGSCSVMTCWKTLRPFEDISKQLHALYHNALPVQYKNDGKSLKTERGARNLLYLEETPNLCKVTANRLCSSATNCATLCCGNNFHTVTREVLVQNCTCWFIPNTYNVTCNSCPRNETIYICK